VEFRITFYQTEDGQKPLLNFLESLRSNRPVLHKLITAGIRKLKNRQNHGEPLTAPISGSMGMMELRVGRDEIARVFFFFRPGQEIVCTNGYVKKRQKLDPHELAKAERYKADWEQRHP
jgi:phage-related protein